MIGWSRRGLPRVAITAAALVATWSLTDVSGARAQISRAVPRTAPYVRVLGIAQDGGFPHAACEHSACRRARDGEIPRHLVSSLAIVLPESRRVYMIDATPDIRQQLDLLRDVRDLPPDRVDRAPIDGLFLTHAHIGHYLGMAFLGFEAVSTTALPVWATPRMGTFLSANGPWSQLVSTGNIRLETLTPDTPVELGEGVTVTAITVPHRDEFSDTVGFIIRGPERSILFVPDTDRWETWQPSLLERLEDIDIALLDGSFYSADELPGRSLEEIPHPLIGTSMALLEDRLDTDFRALFIHLNHSNPALDRASVEYRAIEDRGFAVAIEGQEFGL